MFLATRLEGLPRSLFGINWLVLMALLRPEWQGRRG